MLSKLLIYIIQIFLLRENYKQKQNAGGLKSPFYMKEPWKTWWTKTPVLFLLISCLIFFPSGYKKSLLADIPGNRLHHKLSSDLLKGCWNMSCRPLKQLKYTAFTQLMQTQINTTWSLYPGKHAFNCLQSQC